MALKPSSSRIRSPSTPGPTAASRAEAPHCVYYMEVDYDTCRGRLHLRNRRAEHEFLRPMRSSISSLPTSERLMKMRGYTSKSTAFESPSHLGVTALGQSGLSGGRISE